MRQLTRRRVLGTIGAAIVPLAGCGYRRSLDIAWRRSFDGRRLYAMGDSFAVVWTDAIGDRTQHIDVYDARTGTKRDTVDLDDTPRTVATGTGRWFVSTDSHAVAIDETGERTASMELPEAEQSMLIDRARSPVPVPVDETRLLLYEELLAPDPETVYFGSIGCYDLTRGRRWSIDANALDVEAISEITAATAVGEDVIVAVADIAKDALGGPSRAQYLLRVGTDGTIMWSQEITTCRKLYRLRDAVVAAGTSHVSMLDIETGDKRAEYDDGLAGGSIAVGDRYYSASGTDVRATHLPSGETRWSTTIDQARNLKPVAADERGLYVSSDRGSLSIAPADGDVRWFQSGGEILGLCPSVVFYQFGSVTGVVRQ
ncbi:MAG: PQQ-binding-like beta-propeller repeat protein [Halorhabdus sp.]